MWSKEQRNAGQTDRQRHRHRQADRGPRRKGMTGPDKSQDGAQNRDKGPWEPCKLARAVGLEPGQTGERCRTPGLVSVRPGGSCWRAVGVCVFGVGVDCSGLVSMVDVGMGGCGVVQRGVAHAPVAARGSEEARYGGYGGARGGEDGWMEQMVGFPEGAFPDSGSIDGVVRCED